MKRIRIDQLLVQRGLVDSRESAQRLILAGKVMVAERAAQKPSQLVSEEENVQLLEGLKYASRGGLKLEKALDVFQIDVSGKVALDIGASTGGFTDCLLQRGAKRVYSIDVGYGQLSWRLRHDPRVVVMERTNARYLTPQMFGETMDLAVIDVSFIGAHKILDPLLPITNEVVLLLKPQFEAGPEDVPKGGVIKDPAVHSRVLLHFYRQTTEWQFHHLAESPLLGGSGNREFLVHLRKDRGWTEEQFLARIKELVP